MTVLAVDDEVMGIEALKDAIKEALPDCDLHAYDNGDDALNFVKANEVDIAFLDIELGTCSGVELGRNIKLLRHTCDIVFCTGYDSYALKAFELGASDYLLKPIGASDITRALTHLRNNLGVAENKGLNVVCFGNFEVYYGKEPVRFNYDKSKELFAYLVDRQGSLCTNDEICCALWEDEGHSSYLRTLKKDLIDTFKSYGKSDIIVAGWGALGVKRDQIKCDYFDFLDCVGGSVNLFHGEYMSQYSWAENTLAHLQKNI